MWISSDTQHGAPPGEQGAQGYLACSRASQNTPLGCRDKTPAPGSAADGLINPSPPPPQLCPTQVPSISPNLPQHELIFTPAPQNPRKGQAGREHRAHLLPAQASHSCTWLCPVSSGISPVGETPQPLWAVCSSAQSLLRTGILPHGQVELPGHQFLPFVFYCWAPPSRAWSMLWHPLFKYLYALMKSPLSHLFSFQDLEGTCRKDGARLFTRACSDSTWVQIETVLV